MRRTEDYIRELEEEIRTLRQIRDELIQALEDSEAELDELQFALSDYEEGFSHGYHFGFDDGVCRGFLDAREYG